MSHRKTTFNQTPNPYTMRKLPLLLFIPFLFSCIDEDKPEAEAIESFLVTASADYFGTYNEAYIILHDTDGTPVDFKPIQDGETIEFQVDKSKKYHVSEYKIQDDSGKKFAFINTKLSQDLQNDFTLTNSTSTSGLAPTSIGDFQAKITSEEELVVLLSAKGYFSEYVEPATSVSPSMKVFSNQNRYLAVATTESGHTRYQFINNPEVDNTYELSFNNMENFDHVIKMPVSDFSYFSYNIISQENTEGILKPNFQLANNQWNSTPNEFYELGYLDEFKDYYTVVSGHKDVSAKASFLYQKTGTAPSTIELLNIDEIVISKAKITDFEFGTLVENANYNAKFNSPLSGASAFFEWNVSGVSTKFSLELPEELKNQNVAIANLSDLVLTRSSITKFLEKSESSEEYTQVYQSY